MQEQLKYIKQIYISPVGRSGNQLFQYVLALDIQLKRRTECDV